MAECSHSVQSDFSGVQAAGGPAGCPPARLLCPDCGVEDRKNQSSSQQCGTQLLWSHQGSCKTKIHPSSPVVLVIGGTFRVLIFAVCTIPLLLVAAPRHGGSTTSPESPCSSAQSGARLGPVLRPAVTSNLYQPPDLLTPSNSTLVF